MLSLLEGSAMVSDSPLYLEAKPQWRLPETIVVLLALEVVSLPGAAFAWVRRR